MHFRKSESKYFSRRGLTVESILHRVANIRFFSHTRFWRASQRCIGRNICKRRRGRANQCGCPSLRAQATQSRNLAAKERLDCFGAIAPRNDGASNTA
jgi:hypothetical protein